jgi:hypothetical protein
MVTRKPPANRVGRPPKSDEERLGVQLSVRADPDTDRRLLKVVTQLRSLLPKTAVARVAMRIGLAAVEQDPGALFDEEPLTEDQAERLLMMYWRRIGDAEQTAGQFKVWVLGAPIVDALDETHEAVSSRSFKEALDKLAAKFPPEVPLPWASAQAPKGRASKRPAKGSRK